MKDLKLLFCSLTLLIAASLLLSSCGGWESESNDPNKRIMYVSADGKINSLDPIYAADVVSAQMVAAFYDSLLQYDYKARPYKLIPSMLEKMPEPSPDLKSYKFRLREDLYFLPDPCFGAGDKALRKITSKDVVFSFLRLADPRLHSSGYWIFRGKIKGLDKFREACSKKEKGDNSVYDKACEGFEIIDDRNFVIYLNKPDPRFLYVLAMPYASVVSRQAVEKYGESFAEHPVGSGPFKLTEWIRDYSIKMEKYEGYRPEFFASAENPEDRKRKLPLLDKVVCYLVKQPLANWLLFLQGELDMSALNKDNFDAVVGLDLKLSPALKKRGIKLLQIPEFQVNYVGFCFADPLLAENLNLRKAISLAYDVEKRIKHFNYRLVPAQGPIPPGVAGYDKEFRNPYSSFDIEKAKEYMVKAGFPDGIDPKTGKPLELSFDQMGASPNHRQLAELMLADMKAIGIKIKPVLNNKSRFLQKSRKGELQLFKIGWVGDYPDAENFLQLFYGKNAGSCNRAFYRDKKFDKMFEEIISMPDSPERTRKYSEMVKYLAGQCPWIFESYPIAYKLVHSWLQNYIPHDFAYSSWKYLSVDVKARTKAKRSFEPLELNELR